MTIKSLRRILGVGDGLAIVVGAVIGVGILRTPGLIAGYLAEPEYILAAWLLGGTVALLASLAFAELAAMYPEAGGKFYYAREAFGPYAGFVTGWAEIVVTRGFAAAAKAIVIGEYVILLTGRGAVRPLAAAVVVTFLAINVAGLRTGRIFQNAVTAVKVGLILVIIIAGLWGGSGAGFQAASDFTPTTNRLLGFALAYLAVSATYYGWDDYLKLAGEVKEPGKTLPRVLILGALSVMLLYLLINLAFLSALTPAEAAGSPLVAADAVAKVFGEGGGRLITVAALIILVSSLNVQFMGLPRVALGLARKDLAPAMFARLSGGGTPVVGLLVVSGLIFAMAMTRSFELLIQYQAFVAITIDGMVLVGLFRLRRIAASTQRPFLTPGYPVVPALTLGLYGALFAIIAATQPKLALGGTAVIAVFMLGAWVWDRYSRARQGGHTP